MFSVHWVAAGGRALCSLCAFCFLWAGLFSGQADEVEAGKATSNVYLSDLGRAGKLVVRTGWGTLGLDTAVTPPDGRKPTPLILGKKTYARGLGHHASGEIKIPLEPYHTRFLCDVGVQWQGGNRGSVVFEVWLDGERLFQSPARNDSDPSLPLDIPIAGGKELRLVADNTGDGIGCDVADWCDARLAVDATVPRIGPLQFRTQEGEIVPLTGNFCGLRIGGRPGGVQMVIRAPEKGCTLVLPAQGSGNLATSVNTGVPLTFRAHIAVTNGGNATFTMSAGDAQTRKVLCSGQSAELAVGPITPANGVPFVLTAATGKEGAVVRWVDVAAIDGKQQPWPIRLDSVNSTEDGVVKPMPEVSAAMQQLILEWDWRMQDGIGTDREPVSWLDAARGVLGRARRLITHATHEGRETAAWQKQADAFQQELAGHPDQPSPAAGEERWQRIHAWRRELMFGLAWPERRPIAFVKHAPGTFSHQLTQYYGARARPGGGIFVLDRPGEDMSARELTRGLLPQGNYQNLAISPDGKRLVFAFCEGDTVPGNRTEHLQRVYHLYEIGVDGSGLRQLTDEPFDDFAARYLPDGRFVFTSTRRGGYHRCGRGPCPVYVLATADADGSNPEIISYHETHEWDPAVMSDGRIVYTRWDYVDRSAVYYQQLWSVRPDGTDVRILYGNNTFNPVGIWEARPIPGSRRLMATAAAHHAMTAGSIILLDPAVGVDGPDPITRLTPDALFPESEAPVAPKNWSGRAGVPTPPEVPVEQKRWPGHCYRSPFPLSETLFLASYSFDSLIGEGGVCPANMFGLYIVDSFGNKELLHRDLNIGSVWPLVVAPYEPAPALPSVRSEAIAGVGNDEGTASGRGRGIFMMSDVYSAYPPLPADSIRALRIVQVLPKTTPHANSPRMGLPNASPGKQVLGTVPVEADGSACFYAPARTPLLFQALDSRGRAVQRMRSVAYVQPGETAGCVGCHEPRLMAPPSRLSKPLAMDRPPSKIQPGPDGSLPLSYPILVQPVLDKHCIRCHGGETPKGKIALTGGPAGAFTVSYNALACRVPCSSWQGGNFREKNCEPLTMPDRFGARASSVMTMLSKGHHGVELSNEDEERLVIWMDANALFYGTFNRDDQKRQQKGERIAGPDLE